jgi:hypothetical protein
MSLLAILFSYDAITGERQNGTLRLMIANSLPRTTVLLGKFVGGTASLIIPFVLALLVGVLYINLNPNIQWDGSLWAELGLLTAASVTFIMLFYLLGLMVSSFCRYSSTSILNCLFLWVLLILVIPNVCPYISAQFCRVPSIRETQRQEKEFEDAFKNTYRQTKKEVINKFAGDYGKLFSDFESMEFGGVLSDKVAPEHREAAQRRAATDPEFKAMMDAFSEEMHRRHMEELGKLHEETDKLWGDLNSKAAAQTRLAKNMACISPLANFVYVARNLTGTGLHSLEYFEQAKDKYNDPHGPFWQLVVKKVREAKKNDPTYREVSSFLDLGDYPRFVFGEEPLKNKLGAVLPYWGILGLFNVVFFVAAFAGFIRYDVR